MSEDISSRGLVCITLTGLAVGSASTIRDSLWGAGSSYMWYTRDIVVVVTCTAILEGS